MASLKSLTKNPKFFRRKPGHENSPLLCERCRNHEIIIGAKWGCDYFLFTNVLAATPLAVIDINIHAWCHVDPAPKCLRAYEEVGLVNA